MPVPGSIKRVAFDEREIARLLETQFSLPAIETLAYLKLLETHDMTLKNIATALGISEREASSLMQSMVSKGLIIESPRTPLGFAALHPRMTLTNLFKTYEKEVVLGLRERRATVDRIVNLLTPIYEERMKQT
jgi:sugar-specific transcriptional regulator TrmB